MKKWMKTALVLAAAVCLSVAAAFTALAAQTFQITASIGSCLIGSGQNTVDISLSSNGDTTGTDGKIYLFELRPYESEIGSRTDYVSSVGAGETRTVSIPLNKGTAQDRLYSRFVPAVFDGTAFTAVGAAHYITNPEVVASNQDAFKTPLTKKGLNIQLNMLNDAFTLGVKHVAVNIAFSQFLGSGIDYEYDGKTYHFNKSVVENYDKVISAYIGKDISVTAIVLNDWNDAHPELIHAGTAKSSSANYYMFNTKTQEGFETTRAIFAFLADRYSGKNHNSNYAKISNWILGNEINNQIWNYMGPADLNAYVSTYQQAFRTFYTAIKSTSANDRVYFSLDFWWGAPYENLNDQVHYTGKGIVDTFNALAVTEGQMDWGIAYHPYPYPMTEPEFWDDTATGLVTESADSPIVNFANLHVLTDYLNQDSMKTASGEVRHVILTEEGFTAQSLTRGDVSDIQAAAFAYSYYIVDSNPYIDAYILSRQVDAPSEVRAGLSFGLWSCDMNQGNEIVAVKDRKLWRVFHDIDQKRYTLETSNFAKSIIGINKWSDVIPNFRWKSLEQ